MNSVMLERVPGDAHVYYSADETVADDSKLNRHIFMSCAIQIWSLIAGRMYTPIEVIHSTTPSGMPPHLLQLKPGVPIIVLRNLNQGAGVVNGTRCIVRQCLPHTIYAEICKSVL